MKLTIVILGLLLGSLSRADEWYVAPDGNDSNPGTKELPLLTIGAARDLVRLNTPANGHTVFLRGGWYEMPTGLTFTVDDSGGAGAPVLYRNYTNETPVLVNGYLITNMVSIGDGLYSTDVSTQGFSGISFTALYLDFDRMVHARHPNEGSYFYINSSPTSTSFVADAGDIPDWPGLTQGRVSVYPHNYWIWARAVTGYDSGTRILSFDPMTTPGVNRPYWFNGVPEALDVPREWILTNNVLTFYPPASLGGKRLYAPTGGSLFTFNNGASNIWLRGLTMTGADVHAARFNSGASHNRLLNCKIWGTGSANTVGSMFGRAAVQIDSGSVSNWVHSSEFRSVGGMSVQALGGTVATRTPTHHLIENNSFYGGQEEWIYYTTVTVSGVGHLIRHNYFQDTPYGSISFRDSVDVMIENNYITNALSRTTEGGPIYVWTDSRSWAGSGCWVIGNVIKNCQGWNPSRGHVLGRGAHGMHLDGYSTAVSIVSNVWDNVQSASFSANYGRYHLIANNLMINPTYEGVRIVHPYDDRPYPAAYIDSWRNLTNEPAWSGMRSFDDDPGVDWEGGYRYGKHTITNNVFFSERAGSMFDIFTRHVLNTVNSNTYWSTSLSQTDTRNFRQTIDSGAGFNYNLEQWTGLWGETAAWGDPQIIPGTYTLAAGSPALAMGFQQIDWENAGTYESVWMVDGPDGEEPPGPTKPPLVEGTHITIQGRAVLQGRIR